MAKLVPIIAFFVALILSMVAVPSSIATIRLAHDVESFKSTRATVKLRNEEKHERGPKTQLVRFDYKVGTRKFTGDNAATKLSDSAEDIEKLVRKESDGRETILIYYDPERPSRSAIRKDIPTALSWGFIVATIILYVASIAATITNRRHARVMAAFARQERARKG